MGVVSGGLKITRVEWHPGEAMAAAHRAAEEAEQRGAERLFDAAQERVPYRFGDLADSGSIERVEDGVVVSYSAPYAPILRAHPEWDFGGGRSGRWLDEAIEDQSDAIEGEIVDTFRAVFPG